MDRTEVNRKRDPDDTEDEPLEFVPIHMDPCELREWMKTHPHWVLSLEDTMTTEEIQSLYRRHVESPCPDEGVLSEIAVHPNTPVEILVELARPNWRGTHLALALNTRLPADVLRRLAKTRRLDVLEHIAWNISTPTDVLEHLARHPTAQFVREAAKRNLMNRKTG